MSIQGLITDSIIILLAIIAVGVSIFFIIRRKKTGCHKKSDSCHSCTFCEVCEKNANKK